MDTKLPAASRFKSDVELYRWVRGSFHKILYELGDVLRNGNLTRLLIQLKEHTGPGVQPSSPGVEQLASYSFKQLFLVPYVKRA